MIYLIFVQYMNHRMQITALGIWFDKKLREDYATNDFAIVSRWQQCLWLITTAVHLPDK